MATLAFSIQKLLGLDEDVERRTKKKRKSHKKEETTRGRDDERGEDEEEEEPPVLEKMGNRQDDDEDSFHNADGGVDDDELRAIQVRLEGEDLWRRFHALGTEMIVTKAGRRMFPVLQFDIAGLKGDKTYALSVDFRSVSSRRFRYSFHQSKWVATAPGEAELPSRVAVHPDSPAKGEHWLQQRPVSFDRIKLTNNQLDANGHVIVNSMHRYRPRLHIALLEEDTGKIKARRVITFAETTFMAVTAYQNHRITELKIENNPFAKGFRDSDLSQELLAVAAAAAAAAAAGIQ